LNIGLTLVLLPGKLLIRLELEVQMWRTLLAVVLVFFSFRPVLADDTKPHNLYLLVAALNGASGGGVPPVLVGTFSNKSVCVTAARNSTSLDKNGDPPRYFVIGFVCVETAG
jgi:hypothetical protein